MKLKIDQNVQLQIDNGTEKVVHDCQVKKINAPIITVHLPGQIKRELFPVGTFQDVFFPGNKKGKLTIKIENSRSLPFLDLRLLQKNIVDKGVEENLEEIELKDILNEVNDEKYLSQRSSLRVEDSFPLEFYYQSAKKAEKKKKEYLDAPTMERRKLFLLEKGIVPPEVYYKIEGMESDLFDVFSDVYRRLAVMAGMDVGIEPEENEVAKGKARPENIGTCVDISSTGLKFLCGVKFKRKDILKIMFSPPSTELQFSISALVEVVKVIIAKGASESERYAVVVKYHTINEEDMEILSRYTVLRHMELSRSERDLTEY